MILQVSVYQKQHCFIKRLELYVRTNWFLAVSLWSIWKSVMHRIQKDWYGCQYVKKMGWKDCKWKTGSCFSGRMQLRLCGSPFVAVPNRSELEGRGQITRLGVCFVCFLLTSPTFLISAFLMHSTSLFSSPLYVSNVKWCVMSGESRLVLWWILFELFWLKIDGLKNCLFCSFCRKCKLKNVKYFTLKKLEISSG